MAKKLRKATSKRPPKTSPYVVRIGTRNELGPPKTYLTESAARTAIIKEFESWRPWCTRHNAQGLVAIDQTVAQLSNTTFHHQPARVECCFDELYGMWVVAEFWTTR